MEYLDYREKLGIGFNDEEKNKHFKNAIINYFENGAKVPFSRDSYVRFCSKIGYRVERENASFNLRELANQSKNLQQLVEVFEAEKYSFKEFLCITIMLVNTYDEDEKQKRELKNYVLEQLKKYKYNFEIIKDDDGIFVFPKGAKELDDALVSEPLEWLLDYPKAHSTFVRALKQYSNQEYARDVADNFRKAFEEFLQEFLGNERNLENNKIEICKFLGEHGADSNIGSMFQSLLNSYKNLNDKIVKHNDRVDEKFLEFLMYQTGLFIRMIITIGKQSRIDNKWNMTN